MERQDILPEELLDIFETQIQCEYPFDGASRGPAGTDYDSYWSFRVSEGVGILKVSLRDVFGNEEDFEWELTLKSR